MYKDIVARDWGLDIKISGSVRDRGELHNRGD
jgi:hypothetical protein